MLRLEAALASWGRPEFAAELERELEHKGASVLPLQRAMALGSHVVDGQISVMVKRSEEYRAHLSVCVGVFFKSVIAGCSCADDPTPLNELEEFCELQLDIDKMTAVTTITLLD
ncbi:MAG: hypothetical protein PHP05_05040 [Sideroxydans sp.]|nr:hypothetical protein [Sideroxydans sp.]MDD5471263.1 hypothetical protein [Sideroxydans sp.]